MIDTALDDIIKFAVTIVSILNPIGVIPIFLDLTRRNNLSEIRHVSNSCSIAVGVTILISLIVGQDIINFFGISIASFTIAGGFLLFMMAISMINATQNKAKMNKQELEEIDENDHREIGIVPLAIPLLSGPGAISTGIIHAKYFDTTYHWVGASVVIIFLVILVKLILTYSRTLGEKVGTVGLNIMTRIMGLIVLAMSIEMVAGGIKEIIPILKAT